MEVIEAIYTRRAVRDYQDRPVDREIVSALLEAAVQAPSAVNEQPWVFTVIQDKALLDRYSDQAKALMLKRPEVLHLDPRFREMLASSAFNVFYNARTLIVIWANPKGPGGERAAWDCCFAAQNLMLAAHGKGLGTCPIGFAWSLLETPEVKQELNVPAEFAPILPIIVGYPGGAMPAPPVARNRPEVLCWR